MTALARAVRFLVVFWLHVTVAVFAVATWPVRAVVRRAKRERWSEPR